ncbi:MAG: hypothetical protein AAFR81_03200 [Chloroflexota bacterium]
MQPANKLNSSIEPPSPEIPAEVKAILGDRFAADLADIIATSKSNVEQSPRIKQNQRIETIQPEQVLDDEMLHRQFALVRLRAGKPQGAIDYIKRHAPELLNWMNQQVRILNPAFWKKEKQLHSLFSSVRTVEREVIADIEAARIAYTINELSVYRAWLYAQSLQTGCGWVERKRIESLWSDVGVANGKRQARRIIKQGIDLGYWTQNKQTKRLYLTGQVKVATALTRRAFEIGLEATLEINHPGKKRVKLDCSGTQREAVAKLYTAWLKAKDRHDTGVMISRETLCQLWCVSVPTLVEWEALTAIEVQTNYAQNNDTSIEHVPAHAYLTLNRDGSHAVAWQLPNTYRIHETSIDVHLRKGKSRQVQQAMKVEISRGIEQRGYVGDAASLRSIIRLYFTDQPNSEKTPLEACERHLRSVGRKDGDIFTRRYFYVGKRYGVTIYEPYNIETNIQHTNIHQRLIWQENTAKFGQIREHYRIALAEEHS